jgi:hypothetical protein
MTFLWKQDWVMVSQSVSFVIYMDLLFWIGLGRMWNPVGVLGLERMSFKKNLSGGQRRHQPNFVWSLGRLILSHLSSHP